MWHYNRVIGGSGGASLDPSRRRIDAQRLINPSQGRFRDRRLADMQRVSIPLLEGRGHPSLHREDLAQPGPGHGFTGGFQFAPDRLHQLIGQDGDEQVSSVRSSL